MATCVARIEAGAVVELLSLPDELHGFPLDELFHPGPTWVDASDHPDAALGWHWDGHTLSAPGGAA